jgi:RNA polymerase sigma factor (sigma-70 family)
MSREQPGQGHSPAGVFATTRWSVVLTAGRADSDQAAAALETLCQSYWYPLYAFVRRQGRSPADAQDLTQEFFTRLLQSDSLRQAHPDKGRFRSFLLAALKHFLANEWDRVSALKRGGGKPPFSLDALTAEQRYAFEPVDGESPEKIYDRRWALTVLDQVMARLRREYAAEGKTDLFDDLKDTLTGNRQTLPYAKLGAKLGMSEGAVKVAAHRLRRRYRHRLMEEIAETVSVQGEVDEELRYLVKVLLSD